jgi:glycosyltransferase involved in cell wall biosynthesis
MTEPLATPAAPNDAPPRVSVVIRSCRRLTALAELLERILMQHHDSFEVVVIEQTPKATAAELEQLAPFEADSRVRILRYPPLGGPAARNEGVKNARGAIVLLIDDDDLPLNDDWITAHERVYVNPNVVAVSARMVRTPGEKSPYVELLRPFVRRACMSYSLLMTPYTFARFDEDVENVGWLHGSNASLRREFGLRVGLWDTAVRSSDEHSFAFRSHREMRNGETFCYRAYPPAQQRLDIRGGMDKRFVTVRRELLNNLRYCHRVVGPYHPKRFASAYPVYLGWVMLKTFNWVWDPGRRHLGRMQRVKHSAEIVKDLPGAIREVLRGE